MVLHTLPSLVLQMPKSFERTVTTSSTSSSTSQTPSPTMRNMAPRSPAKLSLLIPPTTSTITTTKSLPILSSITTTSVCGTPIAPKARPKLSLQLDANTRRNFAPGGTLSASRLGPTTITTTSDDESESAEHDVTAKNTVANAQLRNASQSIIAIEDPTPLYTLDSTSESRSILKRRRSSTQSQEGAKKEIKIEQPIPSPPAKTVSFSLTPAIIPYQLVFDQDSETEVEHDTYIAQTPVEESDDSLSPPSTASSFDSDESESDNECKTPIDGNETTTNDRWAAALSSGKRWHKPERQWVWTLGNLGTKNTEETMADDSDVKVWGDELLTS